MSAAPMAEHQPANESPPVNEPQPARESRPVEESQPDKDAPSGREDWLVMDVQLPTGTVQAKYPNLDKPQPAHTWDMSHYETPKRIIEELRSIVIVDGNLTKFKKRLDELMSGNEGVFLIRELGVAVMYQIIMRDATPFVEELLRRGMHISMGFVMTAISSGAEQTIKVFLWNGWDINQLQTELDPPVLGHAAIHNEEMALYLLECGADPNRQCSIDTTPLSWAAQWGTVRTIKVMLDYYDGDVHRGQLLHYAVRRKIESVEVLELLLDRGARINQTMYDNHDYSRAFHFWMNLGTALHEAACFDNVRAARYLLSRGIDTSIKDNKGLTALELARKRKKEKVVKLLEEVESNTSKGSNADDPPSGSNGEERSNPTGASNYCSVM